MLSQTAGESAGAPLPLDNTKPFLRLPLREETLFFLITWFILATGGRSRLLRDPGAFWHTVVGQQILDSGRFPYTDVFSFTFFGKPWIASQWLGEVLMAGIYRLAGWDGLLVMTSALLAGIFAWLFFRLRRAGLHLLLAILVLTMALLGASYHFHVRPHVLSFLFFALMYGRLCDVEAGRLPLKSLWWLLPLFLVWTNSHGAMLGGLATFALVLAGWMLSHATGRESPLTNWRQAAWLWGLFLACGLTALLNPYGLETPRTWLAVMNSSAVSQLIQEHRPFFRLSPGEFGLFLISAVWYVAALAGTQPKLYRATWLVPLAWLVLGLSRIRHGPFFALAATLALADLLPRTRWVSRLAERGWETFRLGPVREPGPGFSRAPLGLSLAAIALLAGLHLAGFTGPGRDRLAQFDRSYWPVELLPALRALPPGTPIFNDMIFGGFLIQQTPNLLVFIDDRCELYGDDFLLAYARSKPAAIEEWAHRYGFQWALAHTLSMYHTYLDNSPRWEKLATSPAGSLYRRRPTGGVG